MQDSLPAGWLTFAARESNPLDRDERFPSPTSSSPFPGFILTLPAPDPVTRHFVVNLRIFCRPTRDRSNRRELSLLLTILNSRLAANRFLGVSGISIVSNPRRSTVRASKEGRSCH